MTTQIGALIADYERDHGSAPLRNVTSTRDLLCDDAPNQTVPKLALATHDP